jgi:hypothetical protein
MLTGKLAVFLGALTVPIALFLYGWTAEEQVHWIVPIVGTAILGFGLFAIFVSSAPEGDGYRLT